MRIVVVSPHRDDAAFSLGLAIAAWVATGHQVLVLNCFTQSDYAPYSDVGSLHPNDRTSFVSAVRRREDAAWKKRTGGALQFQDLDLLDAPLRLVCPPEEVLTVPIRPGDRALTRVAGALSKLNRLGPPGQMAFALPLAVGGHIDHRVVREAGFEALRATARPVGFYEDLPYAAGAGAELDDLAAATPWPLTAAFAEGEREDAGAAVAAKRRMAECYDSQIDSAVAQHLAEFAGRYGGRERMWVNEAWAEAAWSV